MSMLKGIVSRFAGRGGGARTGTPGATGAGTRSGGTRSRDAAIGRGVRKLLRRVR